MHHPHAGLTTVLATTLTTVVHPTTPTIPVCAPHHACSATWPPPGSVRIRGSNPLSSTHFHRRWSATEPVDDASAMRPLSDVGRAGRRALFARCPLRALPAYPAFHADHRRTGAARSTQDRRPTTPRRRSPSATQYLSQPHAPLNSDDPLLRVPKSGQLVHTHRDARVGRKRVTRATRGAMPATVSLIAHPPKRHNHPAAQHRSTRDREHSGETSLVWWPRIWTRNTVEPTRTTGMGRDSLDG
jgi:hypothetical protein